MDYTIETFPNLPDPLPESQKISHTKLPNILKVETYPWDSEVYTVSQEAKGERTKEEIQNDLISEECAIRWREVVDSNGEKKRQSNARFVTWADGSVQLFIGDKIVFNVESRDTSNENNYLYGIINAGSSLSCQAKLNERVSLLPANKYTSDKQKAAMSLSTSMALSKDKKVKTVYHVEDHSKKISAQISDNMKEKHRRERKERKYLTKIGITAQFLQQNKQAANDYDNYDDDDDDDDHDDSLQRYHMERRKRNRKDEAEREKRILSAKSGHGSSPIRKKRAQADDEFESDDENIDDDDGDSQSAINKRRGFLGDDDEEEEKSNEDDDEADENDDDVDI